MSDLLKVEDVRKNEKIKSLIRTADKHLEAIGYTEHAFRHMGLVSHVAQRIILSLGYDQRMAELAAIAGYIHDIGNAVCRVNHPHIGAVMSMNLLQEMGMDMEEISMIMGAIGNHDENYGGEPVNIISAALIIADKSDVHRSRVRSIDQLAFDIHDRVNYAAIQSNVIVDDVAKNITLELKIDTQISQVMEYFEIFLSRMIMCKKAAKYLGCKFSLIINEHGLL